MTKIQLNRNEVPDGPAPLCLSVLRTISKDHLRQYIPGAYASDLSGVLAKRYKIAPDDVLLSNGAEEFLHLLIRRLDPKKDSILTTDIHYSDYENFSKSQRVKIHYFKIAPKGNEFRFDVDDCIRQYKKQKPKLILIASPSNPTGNSITAAELKKILRVINTKTILVLDEAYVGFNPLYRFSEIRSLFLKNKNLVILRTFSKYFALAGIRLGFVFCHQSVREFLSYQRPYLGISRINEQLGIAALNSDSYYKKLSNKIIRERESFIKKINKLHYFKAFTSDANFFALEVPPKVRALFEKKISKEKVVILKPFLSGYYRVTINSPVHMERLFAIMLSCERGEK